MRRRELLGLGAAAALIGRTAAASGFDWQQCRGTSINVSLTANPHASLLQLCEGEFEALTGIAVNSEQVDYQQQRRVIELEFASGKTSFDVATLVLNDQKVEAHRGHWFKDLRPHLADPGLTAPDYDVGDFSDNVLQHVAQADGRIDTLPLNVDYWILYWNKPLFEAAGIAPPDDFDSLLAAARKLHDPQKGIYGWVARGLKNANVGVWVNFMLGYGQVPVADDGTMMTESPEAVAAAQLFATLTREVSPPGIDGFDRGDSLRCFSEGKAALWMEGCDSAYRLEDSTLSDMVGKAGYSIVPRGPKARNALLYANGIGVSASSANPQAAYLYCQWATGKAMQQRALLTASAVPARRSALANPDADRLLTDRLEWLAAVRRSAPIARAGMPQIRNVLQFRDAFGVALANITAGADATVELANATESFRSSVSR